LKRVLLQPLSLKCNLTPITQSRGKGQEILRAKLKGTKVEIRSSSRFITLLGMLLSKRRSRKGIKTFGPKIGNLFKAIWILQKNRSMLLIKTEMEKLINPSLWIIMIFPHISSCPHRTFQPPINSPTEINLWKLIHKLREPKFKELDCLTLHNLANFRDSNQAKSAYSIKLLKNNFKWICLQLLKWKGKWTLLN
jgi:hypothetical protein